MHRVFFTLEDTRRSTMRQAIGRSNFDDASFRREIAAEDHESAGLLYRIIERADHRLPRGFARFVCFFGKRATGGRHCRPVDVSAVEQTFGDHWNAAGLV